VCPPASLLDVLPASSARQSAPTLAPVSGRPTLLFFTLNVVVKDQNEEPGTVAWNLSCSR
jgi:hypothetical protein